MHETLFQLIMSYLYQEVKNHNPSENAEKKIPKQIKELLNIGELQYFERITSFDRLLN